METDLAPPWPTSPSSTLPPVLQLEAVSVNAPPPGGRNDTPGDPPPFIPTTVSASQDANYNTATVERAAAALLNVGNSGWVGTAPAWPAASGWVTKHYKPPAAPACYQQGERGGVREKQGAWRSHNKYSLLERRSSLPDGSNASPAGATAGWPPPPPPPPPTPPTPRPPVRGRKDGVAPGFEITSAHCGTQRLSKLPRPLTVLCRAARAAPRVQPALSPPPANYAT
ncbi:protein enabled homolog [Schistocerca americana]|uniref:protein enabled homolog n=1 Tax=Schistocerca americana TaxID=7009 RepID=UPI001F4F315D|nr:protein enabled homolog [Schistocerca americana]